MFYFFDYDAKESKKYYIMDIIIKNFIKVMINLIYIKWNTMHKRKSIRILYVVAPLQ